MTQLIVNDSLIQAIHDQNLPAFTKILDVQRSWISTKTVIKAIHLASINPYCQEMLELLLQNTRPGTADELCFDPEIEHDITPLSKAIDNGLYSNAQVLLRYGADPKLVTNAHDAIIDGHASCIRLLVSWGYPVNRKDDNGMTLLMKACMYSTKPHLADLCTFLVENGASITTVLRRDITAIELAKLSSSSTNDYLYNYLTKKATERQLLALCTTKCSSRHQSLASVIPVEIWKELAGYLLNTT